MESLILYRFHAQQLRRSSKERSRPLPPTESVRTLKAFNWPRRVRHPLRRAAVHSMPKQQLDVRQETRLLKCSGEV